MSTDSPRPGALDHAAVLEQLPLLAGGGLPAAHRAALESHLDHCPDCRQQWQLEQRLAALWQAQPLPERSPEPALQQLLAQIRDTAAVPKAHRPASWLTGLRQWLGALLSPVGLRPALAGLAALGLGLALLGQPGRVGHGQPSASPGFRVLSSDPSTTAEGRYDLQLLFAPGISPGRRQSLLDSIDGRVLAAPNSLGAVPVRPGGVGNARELAEVLARLRAQPEVLLAEALQPQALGDSP